MDTCCVGGTGALAGKPGQVKLLENWFSLFYLLEELHYSPLQYWKFSILTVIIRKKRKYSNMQRLRETGGRGLRNFKSFQHCYWWRNSEDHLTMFVCAYKASKLMVLFIPVSTAMSWLYVYMHIHSSTKYVTYLWSVSDYALGKLSMCLQCQQSRNDGERKNTECAWNFFFNLYSHICFN